MSFKRSRRRTVVMVLVVLLMAPGCGREAKNDPAAKGSSPRAQGTAASGDERASTGSPLADAGCRDYANAFAGFTPDPSGREGYSNFKQIADSLDEAAEKVPNEISDDLKVVATAYRNFAEATANVDMSDPSSMAGARPEEIKKMEEALKGMDSPEVRTSVANIEKFVKEHCP